MKRLILASLIVTTTNLAQAQGLAQPKLSERAEGVLEKAAAREFSPEELSAIYGDELGEGRKALQTLRGLSAERAQRVFLSLSRPGAQGEVFHTTEETFEGTNHIYLAVLWDPHTAVHRSLDPRGFAKRDQAGIQNPNDWYITADLGFCLIKNPDAVMDKQDAEPKGLFKGLLARLQPDPKTQSVRYLKQRYTGTRANDPNITTAGVLDFLHHTTVRLRYSEAKGGLLAITLEDPHDADTFSFQTRAVTEANASSELGVQADVSVGLASGREASVGIKSEREDGMVAHVVSITDIPYLIRPVLSVTTPVAGQNDLVLRMGIRWQLLAKSDGQAFTPLRTQLSTRSSDQLGLKGAINPTGASGGAELNSSGSGSFKVEQLPESKLRMHAQGEVAVAVEYREEDHDVAYHLRPLIRKGWVLQVSNLPILRAGRISLTGVDHRVALRGKFRNEAPDLSALGPLQIEKPIGVVTPDTVEWDRHFYGARRSRFWFRDLARKVERAGTRAK